MVEKSSDPNWELFYKITDEYSLKTINVVKDKARLRICHRVEETEKTGLQNAIWYSELDPQTEKDIRNTGEIWIKYTCWLIVLYQC